MSKLSKPVRLLFIGLLLILIGSIVANLLQTDFRRVRVKDFYIGTEKQQTVHALAFIPKHCTAEKPCPAVVTSHGWLNSGEVQDAASIELSRRGVVVLAMDAYSHGMSSNLTSDSGGTWGAMSTTGMGMISLVEYLTSGILDYVDTSRIGVMGHSMGGGNSFTTIMHYGRLYNAAIEEAMHPDSDGGEEITEAEQAYADSFNKIWAALPTGAAPRMITEASNPYKDIYANLGVLYGYYEEGGFGSSTGNAVLIGESKEALDLVNFPFGELRDAPIKYVEEGVFYGNKADRTLRVLYQPKTTHPLIHFMPNATRDIIEFFTYVFDLNTQLGPGNQTFLIKELFNFLSMIGLFMIMVPLAQILMSCPLFAELKGEEGPKIPALTPKSRKLWNIGILLTGAISFGAALLSWLIYDKIFVVATKPKAIFNAPTANNVFTWTAIMAIWCMFWFWINFKKDKAAGIRTDEMIGWKITSKEFWKTLLLAIFVIGGVYIVVWFCKWLFNTDFRIWTPAIKTFAPDKLIPFFPYLIAFFLFYLSNALIVNGAMRVEGMSEKKNLFICAVSNIIGAGLVGILQYGKLFFIDHNVLWGPQEFCSWIDPLVIIFAIPVLFLAPYMLRAFYKITGKNWLGPMVFSTMAVMILVMHNCINGLFF
ncbi:MAG: Alpha/beta hydrolase family protein [Chloroflexi bacterium ADurb.Bin120]|uniref:Putative Membrane-spanning protein n=1 Tax=Candidatus Brevifilum fermentans TaxID=1986204 RepID=A0A1Y6K1C0_9CHLR|nr:alpha/beta fold hydrolase [Brevefilum fermentans]MDI9565344.1 hypothetical protein [Chloroflexota bacterium]OQB87993.1 MAG: Alpha/beta hydrolase family protein [Chloroflexi bacterium ADurb.Bin120]SMX53431.1 putative Membrane-spanning protein [Brevefilum fermentans]HOM67549.1 hypothetical protein [Brevefilum fermentans]HPX95499.1 hypothetical protein [Brevefilum fermentans]